jgi:hypothetical protein
LQGAAGVAEMGLGGTILRALGGPAGIVSIVLPPTVEAWDKFKKSPEGIWRGDQLRQQGERFRTGNIGGFFQNLLPQQQAPQLQDVSPVVDPNKVKFSDLRAASNAVFNSPPTPAVASPGRPVSSTRIPTGRGAAPATSPNTITQAADDDYKQLLSQYGGQSGVNQLAGLTSLPTSFTPEGGKQAASLKDYYAAQQAVGGKNINDIITSMGYSGPMAEWAKANPMLAQREFAKRQASRPSLEGDLSGYGINANLGAGAPTSVGDFSAPSPYAPMTGFALNNQVGSAGGPGYNAPPVSTGIFSPFKYGSENFGNPANPVVAPPAQTQRVLNAPFNEAMAQAGRGLNPDNYTSQTPAVSKKAEDFLNQPWLQGFGR